MKSKSSEASVSDCDDFFLNIKMKSKKDDRKFQGVGEDIVIPNEQIFAHDVMVEKEKADSGNLFRWFEIQRFFTLGKTLVC